MIPEDCTIIMTYLILYLKNIYNHAYLYQRELFFLGKITPGLSHLGR